MLALVQGLAEPLLRCEHFKTHRLRSAYHAFITHSWLSGLFH